MAIQLFKESLILSQNLNGETLVGHITLSSSSGPSSYDVKLAIATTHTNMTLNGGNCKLETCHVTLSHTLIGSKIFLNEALQLGGITNITSYIRSKLSTSRNFIGCLGVGRIFIIISNI